MYSIIHKVTEQSPTTHLVVLGTPDSDWSKFGLSEQELEFVAKELAHEQLSVSVNQYTRTIFIECFKSII